MSEIEYRQVTFGDMTDPTDEVVLRWLRERLIDQYGESENTDFVRRLGQIILKMNLPSIETCVSWDTVRKYGDPYVAASACYSDRLADQIRHPRGVMITCPYHGDGDPDRPGGIGCPVIDECPTLWATADAATRHGDVGHPGVRTRPETVASLRPRNAGEAR